MMCCRRRHTANAAASEHPIATEHAVLEGIRGEDKCSSSESKCELSRHKHQRERELGNYT